MLSRFLFVWAGVKLFGLKGTGIAFFLGYVFYWLLIYAIVRTASGFRWSPANQRIGLLFTCLIGAVFSLPYFLPPLIAWLIGGALAVLAGIYSLKALCGLIPFERFPAPIRRLLVFFRMDPSSASD